MPTPPSSREISDRPFHVVLAGAGFIAGIHLEVLKRLSRVEVLALCDPNLARAENLARRFGIPRSYRSTKELLSNETPDVAHVLVPPPLHAPVAETFLARGVSVFVEKPLAPSSEECRRLIEVASANGARLGVNHNLRFHPSFLRLLSEVARGRIGAVEHVRASFAGPLRALTGRDFENWMLAEPRNIVFEQAPHPFSLVHALLGRTMAARTLASTSAELVPGRVFYDTWRIALRCERGTAEVFLGPGREVPESAIEVLGKDGAIRLDLSRNLYARGSRGRDGERVDSSLLEFADAARKIVRNGASRAGWALSTLGVIARRDSFFLGMRGSIDAFHAALRSGAPPPSGGEEGLAVVESCERAVAAIPRPQTPPLPSTSDRAPRPGEVLVVGGTGFIGGNLVRRLLEEGRPVSILARRPLSGIDPRVRIIPGNVLDRESLARASQGCAAVVHLATGGGDSPAEIRRSFEEGTRNVAEACLASGVGRLLYTSSIAALYLGGEGTATEEALPDEREEKRAAYSRAKIACERLLLDLRRARGLRVAIFRPGVVVGRGGSRRPGGVGQWADPARCIGWSRGTNPLPFVLVEDVAEAFARALSAEGIEEGVFHLVGDVRPTALEWVAELSRREGSDVRFRGRGPLANFAVEWLKWRAKRALGRPDAARPSLRDLRSRGLFAPFDCSLTKRALGWKPIGDRETFFERAILLDSPREPFPEVPSESPVRAPSGERALHR